MPTRQGADTRSSQIIRHIYEVRAYQRADRYVVVVTRLFIKQSAYYIPGRGGSSLRIVTEAYAGETTRAPGADDKNTSNCSGPSGNTSSTKVMNKSRKLTPGARMSSLVSGMKSSPTVHEKIKLIINNDRFW